MAQLQKFLFVIGKIMAALLMVAIKTGAQNALPNDTTSSVQVLFSGYTEIYYSYDFNKPQGNSKPAFFYNHHRHNEFNANLAFVKAAYQHQRIRGNLALGAGTYMNTNYAAEEGVLKNLLEANVGVRLSKNKNIWMDAGILPSHIGFESAIGKENWTLTRSLAAENSPYFESGVKFTYTIPNDKLTFSALALNGWQRITRINGSSLFNWGAQVNYRPTEKATFNYSTFIGSNFPDSSRRWRYFNNLFGIFEITERVGLIAGLDVGWEQKEKHSRIYHIWFTPVGILRYRPDDKWTVAIRGEYFKDEGGVVIKLDTAPDIATWASSINIDYSPAQAVLLRIEGRRLQNKVEIFRAGDVLKRSSSFLTAAVALSF